MLNIKILATLLLALIVCGVVISKTASQARITTNRQVNESAPITEKARTKCNVEAYRAGFASDEPKTTIVRAKPDKNSAIIKTVVTKDEVVYSISGSNNQGWFEISKIEAVSNEEETLFEGRGWVHSSLLDTGIANADPKLRVAPQKNSRILKKLIPEESEARPLDCQGNWMKIKSGKTIGWLSHDGQCANPLTTCS